MAGLSGVRRAQRATISTIVILELGVTCLRRQKVRARLATYTESRQTASAKGITEHVLQRVSKRISGGRTTVYDGHSGPAGTEMSASRALRAPRACACAGWPGDRGFERRSARRNRCASHV